MLIFQVWEKMLVPILGQLGKKTQTNLRFFQSTRPVPRRLRVPWCDLNAQGFFWGPNLGHFFFDCGFISQWSTQLWYYSNNLQHLKDMNHWIITFQPERTSFWEDVPHHNGVFSSTKIPPKNRHLAHAGWMMPSDPPRFDTSDGWNPKFLKQ